MAHYRSDGVFAEADEHERAYNASDPDCAGEPENSAWLNFENAVDFADATEDLVFEPGYSGEYDSPDAGYEHEFEPPEESYAPGAWEAEYENEYAGDGGDGEAMLEALLQGESITSQADMVGLASFAMGPTLRRGARGSAVETLQQLLNKNGASLTVDGDFGRNTENAVRDFQRSKGLSADGIAGPSTKMALVAAQTGGVPTPTPIPTPTPAPTTGDLGHRIAEVARRELARWRPGGRTLQETDPAATPLLQEYYQTGINVSRTASQLQSASWQGSNPWSAVFISYCMRTAGAGSTFRYSAGHYVYVAQAKRNRVNEDASSPFWAYGPHEVPVQVGDMVCFERASSGVTYDNVDSGRSYSSHCDIITEISGRKATAIGGNLSNSVSSKTIDLNADGTVASTCYAIVRCRGAIGSTTTTQASEPSSAPGPSGSGLGSLPLFSGGREVRRYSFTPEDRLWTARLIVGEAGGRDTPEDRAVIQCVINRYAVAYHRHYSSFADFLRAFSTTLQPVLRNWRAAKAHMNSPQFERATGTYSGHPEVPRGQLRQHLELQKTSWQSLPQTATRLASEAISGRMLNPGIGNADNFASTRIWYKRKHGDYPTEAQWRTYTEQVGREKGRWIGDVPGLNQMKNAFFVSNQAMRISAGAVRVIP